LVPSLWASKEKELGRRQVTEPKRLPRALLSVEDIEAILREAVPDTASGLRDRAMLELLYSTGLRRMEVTRLALYDIDLSRRLVLVREGKGKKDRVVPLGERAAAWLIKYLAEARPALLATDNAALFITDLGETILPENLASKVKRYMHRAGIDKVGAVHLFRHACATHMLDNGADVRYIQALLGHANLETTEIYTHVSIEKLQQIHAATHPAKLTRTARPASDDDESTL
jgi:integrase/recombinase XerD